MRCYKYMNTSQLIPSHTIGTWLLGIVDSVLDKIGLEHNRNAEEIIYALVVLALSLAIGWLVKTMLLAAVRKLVKLHKGSIGTELLQLRTLAKCSHIIPPLVFLGMVPIAFAGGSRLLDIIERLAGVYALVALGIGLGAVINFIFYHYNAHENSRNLPIKGVRNISIGLTWIILVILAVSVLVDKSPTALLTGLGAFAAALMLIFKDSILGFVAGIQMSQNDMLHVGDWIVVPSTPANGTVLDVSLSAVKVQNWDNTIVTVPPYTLVSTSFQNYRGMKDSGARRITKTLTIDVPTVCPLTEALTAKAVGKHPELKEFIDGLRGQGQTEQTDGGLAPVNGTIETNLGLFRAYICLYIRNNPKIAKDQTVLIRLLDPTDTGLPLQIYCFTATTDWDAYEGIQSAVVEHVVTAAADFGLGIYTSSSVSIDLDTETDAATTTMPPKA